MSISSIISSLPRARRRNLNLSEVEVIIESFPHIALLLELDTNKILIANANAAEFTAYTRAELIDLQIDELLPGFLDAVKRNEDGRIKNHVSTKINKRNGSCEEVLVFISYLNKQGSCVVASIESITMIEEKQSELERQEARMDLLFALIQALQERNIQQALENALKIGKKLTGASMLVLYLANPLEPELLRRLSLGETENFPNQIPLTEIEELNAPSLWLLGRHVSNFIQKYARASNFVYVATAPIGKQAAISGLVVAADKTNNPPADIKILLQIISSTISIIIQLHSISNNARNVQKKLQYSTIINNHVFGNISDGIIILNSDLCITEMNSAAEWMLGYAGREVNNAPIENVIIGAENLVTALQAAQEGISTPNLGNIRLHRRDGTAFLSHLHIEPLLIIDKFDGVIIYLRDLSEREEIEERNQQLEQRAILGEVTSIFAHEIRNPLNNLSTGLQLMARNLPDGDPILELIYQFQEDLNRITHLTESTLEFARPTETKMESVDTAILLDRLLNRWHPRLARLNIMPEYEVHHHSPITYADPRALEQVFSNLIGNAVDAMSSTGGKLGISIRAIDTSDGRNQIEISISDTGPGIPENVRSRIFEPFFTTKNHKGTGLGLAIAKRIVTRHNGTIDINSVPGGSVFLVVLPAYESKNP